MGSDQVRLTLRWLYEGFTILWRYRYLKPMSKVSPAKMWKYILDSELLRWTYVTLTTTWKYKYVKQDISGYWYKDKNFPIEYRRRYAGGVSTEHWDVWMTAVTLLHYNDITHGPYASIPAARRASLRKLALVDHPGAALTLEAMKDG